MNALLGKVRRKLFRIYLNVLYGNISINDKELRSNWSFYRYLKKKYNSFISGLPTEQGVDIEKQKRNNIIWWCWLQGEEKAPELCKACLASLRKYLPDKEIRIVTLKNYDKYVSFPDYIIDKFQKGIISTTHFSDLLRLELLIKYGGIWIDSSVLCTGYDSKIFDNDFFVFTNRMKDDKAINCSSWFIIAGAGNQILVATRDLLMEYWRTHSILGNYYMLHICFKIACEKYPNIWKSVPTFSNVPPHQMQYILNKDYSINKFNKICSVSRIHKLSQKIPISNPKSVARFIIKEYLENDEDGNQK